MNVPAVIEPLIRRHASDAAFYWMQIREDANKQHLGDERRAHFRRLLDAHLEGLAVAGDPASEITLFAMLRWRKTGESYVAARAVLQQEWSDATQRSMLCLWDKAPCIEPVLKGVFAALLEAPVEVRCHALALLGSGEPAESDLSSLADAPARSSLEVRLEDHTPMLNALKAALQRYREAA